MFTGSAFGGFFPTKLSDPRHAMAVWKPDVLCDGVLAAPGHIRHEHTHTSEVSEIGLMC